MLALVDAVFKDGPARQGVVADDGPSLLHLPDRLGHAGSVELWPLLRPAETPAPEPWQVPLEPERVASATGAKQARTISRTFDTSPIPNQMIMSGR